jgi:hypothetical protein
MQNKNLLFPWSFMTDGKPLAYYENDVPQYSGLAGGIGTGYDI